MIDPGHGRLGIVRQCGLVSISRSSFYDQGKGEAPVNLNLMRLIDGQFLETPWYGSRQMARHSRRLGDCVGRKRVRRPMRLMGLSAIYQKPRTSDPHPDHRIYPDLLRGLEIDRANQVWCSDITYIPMRRGFLYLVALMDWWSRKVLAWRLSHTMDADFCVEALEAALARHGKPEIFNSDRGGQFTSPAFTQVLKDAGVKISMDGKGRLDGQRLYRAIVALAEVRMRLSPGLRDRLPSQDRDRPLDRLLQHFEASFGVRWTHPRGGLYWAPEALAA